MGWMQAENIKFTLEQQMVFFARLVGHFNVADDINPIKIDNFDWLVIFHSTPSHLLQSIKE